MTDNIIYWATIRNQTQRHSYIELAHVSGNRWVAILDDEEIKFRSESEDFLELLESALQARSSQ